MIVSGVIVSWSGRTVKVRLDDGRTLTVDSNNRTYRGIGTKVTVAVDSKTRKAVLI